MSSTQYEQIFRSPIIFKKIDGSVEEMPGHEHPMLKGRPSGVRGLKSASSRSMIRSNRTQPHGGPPGAPGSPPLRFWNSLAFRVALVVNLTVVAVIGVFAVLDYRRERSAHLREEFERLREEARVIGVARAHAPDRDAFQRFIDDFCRQMSSAASPGHHIILLDGDGEVLMRAHERGNPDLEARMSASARSGSIPAGAMNRFEYGGEGYLSVAVPAHDDATVAVAQSLAPVERIIGAQRLSRMISLGMLVILVFAVTTLGLWVWVRRPLRALVAGVAAMGRGRFDVRVASSGSSELRYLGQRINEMADALGRVEARRRAEMERARSIQRGLLPCGNHHVSGFDIATIFLPTDSVGGDLFDIVELKDGSTLLVIIDVSGHGVAAALCTALLRTVLRHRATQTCDLARIAEAMNRELGGITDHGGFATCFYARLLKDSNEVEYLSAGHDPAFVIRAGGLKETLARGGFPLGIEEGTIYRYQQARLEPGDRLFLYTDGLHEVFDLNGNPFGRNRLEDMIFETRSLPPQEQLSVVIRGIRAFQHKNDFADDVTLLCACRR